MKKKIKTELDILKEIERSEKELKRETTQYEKKTGKTLILNFSDIKKEN